MKLTTKARKALPKAAFAGPGRSYPIPDASHARNALSRLGDAPMAQQAAIKAKVEKKFPLVGKSGK